MEEDSNNNKRPLDVVETTATTSPLFKKPCRVTMENDGRQVVSFVDDQLTTTTKPRKQKKIPWTKEEDNALRKLVGEMPTQKEGEPAKWTTISKKMGIRSGKQCRERWYQHLRPGLVKGNWTEQEDALIAQLQGIHGNKWSLIAESLPHRTDNDIKNRWNSKKKQEKRKKEGRSTQAVAAKPAAAPNKTSVVHPPTTKTRVPAPTPSYIRNIGPGKQWIMGAPLYAKPSICDTRTTIPSAHPYLALVRAAAKPTKFSITSETNKANGNVARNVEWLLLGGSPPPLASPDFRLVPTPNNLFQINPNDVVIKTPSPFSLSRLLPCTPLTFCTPSLESSLLGPK